MKIQLITVLDANNQFVRLLKFARQNKNEAMNEAKEKIKSIWPFSYHKFKLNYAGSEDMTGAYPGDKGPTMGASY